MPTPARLVGERQVVLVLLGGVQLEDGGEAVEQAPQLGEVDLVDPVRPDVVDELAQPMDLVRDLDVCPAHRAHGIAPSEEAPERRIEHLFLGLLMRLDLLDQHPLDSPHLFEGRLGRQRPEGVGDLAGVG